MSPLHMTLSLLTSCDSLNKKPVRFTVSRKCQQLRMKWKIMPQSDVKSRRGCKRRRQKPKKKACEVVHQKQSPLSSSFFKHISAKLYSPTLKQLSPSSFYIIRLAIWPWQKLLGRYGVSLKRNTRTWKLPTQLSRTWLLDIRPKDDRMKELLARKWHWRYLLLEYLLIWTSESRRVSYCKCKCICAYQPITTPSYKRKTNTPFPNKSRKHWKLIHSPSPK